MEVCVSDLYLVAVTFGQSLIMQQCCLVMQY